MTDLDRKIAELKGWRPLTAADLAMMNQAKVRQPSFHALLCKDRPDGGLDLANDWETACTWSTSDAKALKLVDELRKEGFCFSMFDAEDGTWFAQFDKDPAPEPVFCWNAATRPEAICLAYIAAREFINQKGR